MFCRGSGFCSFRRNTHGEIVIPRSAKRKAQSGKRDAKAEN
jgi:hypothetical protein